MMHVYVLLEDFNISTRKDFKAWMSDDLISQHKVRDCSRNKTAEPKNNNAPNPKCHIFKVSLYLR